MDDRDTLAFSDVLASTAHDTKNSLGMLYNTVEQLIVQCQQRGCEVQRDLFLLQYELRRLNHNFIRVLALYKAQQNCFSLRIDYQSVGDCLDEAILGNEPLLSSKGIEIVLECEETLFWAFDKELIMGILESALNNEYLYAKDKIRVSAGTEAGFLWIRMEDNGPGYPQAFLMDSRKIALPADRSVSFLTGSTGLGLYFAAQVAAAHTREDRAGYLVTANGGTYGGSVLTLYLP